MNLPKDQATQGTALVLLLVLGGLSIAGPSGVLAWSDNVRLLDERNAQIAQLENDNARLTNLNALLHPDRADKDLVGELLRSRQNVVHQDEIVLILDED